MERTKDKKTHKRGRHPKQPAPVNSGISPLPVPAPGNPDEAASVAPSASKRLQAIAGGADPGKRHHADLDVWRAG